jgi:hypothetical protein
LEVIQQEVAQWPPETVRRLQGYLVSLNHQREGQRDRFAAKLDDPKADRWVSLEEAEAQLGI